MKPKLNVLFIYTIEALTGLSAKAKKIEEGFNRNSVHLDTIYFYNSQSKFRKLFNYCFLHFIIINNICKNKYTTIYIRYAYYFVFIYIILRIANQNYQIEINSKSQNEFYTRKQFLRKFFDKIALKVGISFAGRIHVVSNELLIYFRKRYNNKIIIFNPNFVVDEHYFEKVNALSSKLNIVFLGNSCQAWHGIDKFIQMIIDYGKHLFEKINIHIIGKSSPAIERIVYKYHLNDTIYLHGFLSGYKKHLVLDQMNIGISGFDLQAIGLKETTGIKVGEYLYSGLPIIIGYEDPSVPSYNPFVQKIDMSKPIISINHIEDFIDAYYLDPKLSIQAHEYAKINLTVDNYIKRIIF